MSIYTYGLYDLGHRSAGLDGLSLFECELLELEEVFQMLAMAPVLREGDSCFEFSDLAVKASHSLPGLTTDSLCRSSDCPPSVFLLLDACGEA